jgi:hypothetical protein
LQLRPKLNALLVAKTGREKVLVLVKALPHVGQRHGETVCCAGVTAAGEWRRQYPIHFRRLDNQFKRWDWIEYDWAAPTGEDRRLESRRVQEDTISVAGNMPKAERAAFLNRIVVSSTAAVAGGGGSLALVRPRNVKFSWKEKTPQELASAREAYQRAANQLSFFDKELAALEPCPFTFLFRYDTGDGKPHRATCDDWETSATFYRFAKTQGTSGALASMEETFGRRYPERGMVFAMGTHSRYPDVWLLVGILRLDDLPQLALHV